MWRSIFLFLVIVGAFALILAIIIGAGLLGLANTNGPLAQATPGRADTQPAAVSNDGQEIPSAPMKPITPVPAIPVIAKPPPGVVWPNALGVIVLPANVAIRHGKTKEMVPPANDICLWSQA